ncbi:MAG TPA: DNA-binding protein [Lachnospiraceae bacterium]|nr:DNA-binding protein [Lachnospiraceae bacterium]
MLSGYPDILTTKDACELLKVSKHTIYKLINSKELKARKVANHYRIQKMELLSYLNKGE